MSRAEDFLVEIGTEELPPKALRGLMLAFAQNLEQNLREHRLAFSSVQAYASPRRLAVIVARLATAQDDQEVSSKGPPVSVAFDADGKATAAALAFARKCGVSVDDLQRSASAKGEWLVHTSVVKGAASTDLLPGCVNAALAALPIPRRMRWGRSSVEFVRPVHWVLMLQGNAVIPAEVLGISAGRQTQGHRFLAPGPLTVKEPGAYLSLLERQGYVLADFDARLEKIRTDVAAAAAEYGGMAVGTDALYEEVAALNEWPVALIGHFDASFLALPREVIVTTLTNHQRYFCVAASGGELLPAFIAIANIESTDPQQVRRGNERVIRPRLADAAFFWEADKRVPLESWQTALKTVVYQKGLGSLHERSARIEALAEAAAAEIGADVAAVKRAAFLAKCDLLSAMVGEFPELQGIMGRYYAQAGGEAEAVSQAIGEQYLPRFSGDDIPASKVGCCLAMADKLDALCGLFALGKKPSGNRDPFGLRRSALGLVRIVIEGGLEINLMSLIATSVSRQNQSGAEGTQTDVYDFIVDRMRAYCLEREGVSHEMFASVRERRPESLLDLDERLRAVASFVTLESAASLAATHKRIANILRKANYAATVSLDPALLGDGAEKDLYEALCAARDEVAPLLQDRRYTDALTRLARLRERVDGFFDDVMVMTDDAAVKQNRLTLLAELRAQFLNIADISRLSIGKG